MKPNKIKTHSPGAVLDYSFNWGTPTDEGPPWLEDGDTLLTSVWEATPEGLTLSNDSVLPTAIAVVFVGGGQGGVTYMLKNTITTAQGRTDSRVMQLNCKERGPS